MLPSREVNNRKPHEPEEVRPNKPAVSDAGCPLLVAATAAPPTAVHSTHQLHCKERVHKTTSTFTNHTTGNRWQ